MQYWLHHTVCLIAHEGQMEYLCSKDKRIDIASSFKGLVQRLV